MTVTTEQDVRRIRRINLPLPIRVEHSVAKGSTFNEITRLIDVSAFGAGFNLQQPIKRGRLLLMTIPLSRQLRSYDYLEPQYKVWGIVCHCIPVREKKGSKYAIGTAFIGKYPPSSYQDNPAKLFDITHREETQFWQVVEAPNNPDESHLPKEDRRHTRYQIPITVTLELLDDIGNAIAKETTVTENISLGGASVFTSLNAGVGSFLRITSDQYNVTLTSIIRGRRQGRDSIPRLHLEFFDRYFPLEGIE
jgi:PilZ domain